MGRSSCGLWNGTNKRKQSSKSHGKAHVLCLGHWWPPLIRLGVPPTPLPTAGNCWLRQARNGRCQVLYKTDLSKEECCKSGRLTTSWTAEDVNDNTLFKWMIFNGGAPNCIPCKGEGVLAGCSLLRSGSGRGWSWGGGARRELEGGSSVLSLPSSSGFWGASRTSPGIAEGTPISACRLAHREEEGRHPLSSLPSLVEGIYLERCVLEWEGTVVLLCALGSQYLFFFKQFWHQVCSARLVLKWCLFPSIRNMRKCGLWTREEM